MPLIQHTAKPLMLLAFICVLIPGAYSTEGAIRAPRGGSTDSTVLDVKNAPNDEKQDHRILMPRSSEGWTYQTPPWWTLISENFTGINLKRCVKREFPPTVGDLCATQAKTCYFGNQNCYGSGDDYYPSLECQACYDAGPYPTPECQYCFTVISQYPTSQCFCDGDGSSPGTWSCEAVLCPPGDGYTIPPTTSTPTLPIYPTPTTPVPVYPPPTDPPSPIPSPQPSPVPSTVPTAPVYPTPTTPPPTPPIYPTPTTPVPVYPPPTDPPSPVPSPSPSTVPSPTPSTGPSLDPSAGPSLDPSAGPSPDPSATPSDIPSKEPTYYTGPVPTPDPTPPYYVPPPPSQVPSTAPSPNPY